MRALRFISLALLLGCGPLEYSAGKSYRDLDVRISTSTRVAVPEIKGRWYTIGDFREIQTYVALIAKDKGRALTPQDYWGNKKCSSDWWFQPLSDWRVRIGSGCNVKSKGVGTPYRTLANGRFKPIGKFVRNQPELLVLWIDEDARTMVVGRKDGTLGAILNRTPTLRADRLKAAKDILKFNGYDLSQLKMVPQ